MSRIAEPASANDRLKARFREGFAASLIAATLLHLLVFQLFPEMTAEVWADAGAEVVVLTPLEEIPLPAAPEELTRPVRPVITTDVTVDETLPVVDFDRVAELPPPPPPPTTTAAGSASMITPFTVAPRLIDPEGFQRALERAYPGALRDARIGGRVELLIDIDEEGRMLAARLGTSSGYEGLDRAALDLAERMRFTPALNGDRRVAVTVQIPVEFRVRR